MTTTAKRSSDTENVWDMTSIRENDQVGIFAPRGSGRVFFISDLIVSNRERFPNIVLVSPVEKMNRMYKPISDDIPVNDLDFIVHSRQTVDTMLYTF